MRFAAWPNSFEESTMESIIICYPPLSSYECSECLLNPRLPEDQKVRSEKLCQFPTPSIYVSPPKLRLIKAPVFETAIRFKLIDIGRLEGQKTRKRAHEVEKFRTR